MSLGDPAWSAYEASEAGTEASAAGKPTNPMGSMSRGGRRRSKSLTKTVKNG